MQNRILLFIVWEIYSSDNDKGQDEKEVLRLTGFADCGGWGLGQRSLIYPTSLSSLLGNGSIWVSKREVLSFRIMFLTRHLFLGTTSYCGGV